jgi:hypothetical protein
MATLMDIPHESSGESTSSWKELHNADKYDVVIGVVRHPYKVVSSCQTLSPTSWAQLGCPGGFSLSGAMKSWVRFNEHMRQVCDYWIRIEDLEFIGSKKINSRNHGNLTTQELASADPVAFQRMVELGREFGYIL